MEVATNHSHFKIHLGQGNVSEVLPIENFFSTLKIILKPILKEQQNSSFENFFNNFKNYLKTNLKGAAKPT